MTAKQLSDSASGKGSIEFAPDRFVEPEAIYWPGYFWLWNGLLEPDVLRAQLRDMRAHDARSVCVLPMPREFRPDSSNNQMDVSYLGPEFFQRVQVAVEEASRLGMNYWLYDEGGWPSGSACGQVTQGHPELRASIRPLRPDASAPVPGDGVDRLSPEATRRFIQLTHDGYREAVARHFGAAIRFAFTDEPAAGEVLPGTSLPWTEGFGELFEKRFGYRIEDQLDSFRRAPNELTVDDRRVRVDFFDGWSQRFVDAYFRPLQRWCHEQGLRSGGHLGGEDETLGAVTYGFGQILRALRATDLPGVDAIWRQIFPGQSNHHFPIFAATAAHQIGSPYAFTESFAVYGNGLTPDQMKWVTDYQYVRGLNLLVGACYPLSTRDHLMGGERPHFGPVNPLWDYLPAFHAYAARLGYVLSCGQPDLDTAVYYPIRDMWANGVRDAAVAGYEALVETLLANQCGFDLIDDDALAGGTVGRQEAAMRVGPMRYRRLLFPPCAWLSEAAAARLVEFVRSGGEVLCLQSAPAVNGDRPLLEGAAPASLRVFGAIDELVKSVPPVVQLTGSSETSARSIRTISRKLGTGSVCFLFNEGAEPFAGTARFPHPGPASELDLATGRLWSVPGAQSVAAGRVMPLEIPAGGSRLFLFGEYPAEPRRQWQPVATLPVTDNWQARPVRQFTVGPHDYEIQPVDCPWEPVRLGAWSDRYSAEFSGDVAYRVSVAIPDPWRNCSWKLNLGRVEYAAAIRVNGREIGRVIGEPYEIDLPALKDSVELEIVVTNTLANALTSARVRDDWKRRQGPGWPGPYDARAVVFENESRGGGLFGPVGLQAGSWQPPTGSRL